MANESYRVCKVLQDSGVGLEYNGVFKRIWTRNDSPSLDQLPACSVGTGFPSICWQSIRAQVLGQVVEKHTS